MGQEFFKEGLLFECQRCSYCCRHEPGYVFLSERDLKSMAEILEITEDLFIQKYCIKVDIGLFSRISLMEKENHDCIFWSEDGCLVYKARPLQCRSYPFWGHVIEDEESWIEEGKSCPGINKGKNHSKTEIEGWLKKRVDEPLISS
ncbi:MAG: YkgJ family cysteine cluster protein [Deltaproteobacteria bacterium]|nr:YkgJ family cysteine cluster protein [Deltaproteobacteria bacterium]